MTELDENMDRVFRDKLADLEKAPPAFVWDNLQSNLAAIQRRKILLYWRVASVAAVLVLAFVAYWQMDSGSVANKDVLVQNTQEQTFAQPIVSDTANAKTIIEEMLEESTASSITTTEKVISQVAATDTRIFASSNTFVPNAEKEQVDTHATIDNPGFIETIKAFLNSDPIESFDLALQNPLMQKALFTPEELRIIEQNKTFLASNSKTSDPRKWLVGAAISPVYSINETSQTDDYSRSMTNTEANDQFNVGGGFSFEYKTQKKWSFQSGVYYNKIEQSSSNSAPVRYSSGMKDNAFGGFFNTPVTSSNDELLMNSVAGVIQIENLPSSAELTGSLDREMLNSTSLVSDANFDQNFEYLEIPLYVKYQLVDAKVGVQLLSGVSTNILVGNSVYMQNEEGRDKIGKTNGMVDLNYSGVLGVGLNYALSSKLFLNVEPRFKYYFNSLNENSSISYKQHSFGVYTGISYSF